MSGYKPQLFLPQLHTAPPLPGSRSAPGSCVRAECFLLTSLPHQRSGRGETLSRKFIALPPAEGLLSHRGWGDGACAGSLQPLQTNLCTILGETSLFTSLLGNTEPDLRLRYNHDIVLMACVFGVVSLTTPNPGSWFSTINYIFPGLSLHSYVQYAGIFV